MTTYNAYAGWKRAVRDGGGFQFCHKYHLSQNQLQQVEEQKLQLLVNIEDAGLIQLTSQEHDDLHQARQFKIRNMTYDVPDRFNAQMHDASVAAAISLALYPKLLRRDGQGYRNVYTNQSLHLASTSINRIGRPPLFLAYLEATQTKNGKLNAFHTVRVTNTVLALLYGTADFRFFAGLVELDHGRIRLSARGWKDLLALQCLRRRCQKAFDQFLASPEIQPSSSDKRSMELLFAILGGPQSMISVVH